MEELGTSPCLLQSLDLQKLMRFRGDKTADAIINLKARCLREISSLGFRGDEIADAIINLRARRLHEISGDLCKNITNTTLFLIAILQLGPFCDRSSSVAIKAIAICCRNLRKLRLSGIRDIDGDAINALAKRCLSLIEIVFVDCRNIDEVAVGNLVSLRFLSVAGTTSMNWDLVSQHWTKRLHRV